MLDVRRWCGAAVLLLAACNSANTDSTPASHGCAPGQSSPCGCADGSTSTQVCNSDGASFGLCACGAVGAAGSGIVGGAGVSGTAGASGAAGAAGTQGGAAGTAPQAGTGGLAGTGAQDGGMAGTGMDAGTDAGMPTGSDPETGRCKGITAMHNLVRANASNPTPNPALPPLTWSVDLAKTAQAYAEKLAAQCSNSPAHSMAPGLGENLAASFGATMSAQQAVDGWAGEKACWTYGDFGTTDACNAQCASQMHSDGCGHYTQIIWRDTTQLGCGVASCGSGAGLKDYWICNYSPQGNIVYQPTARPPY
jgi:pathogenesis-related protein 1